MPGQPTMRRRWLALTLLRLRKSAGLTQEQVADAMGERWDNTKVQRIEGRRQGIRGAELGRLLDLYGVTDSDKRDEILKVAWAANERSEWQAHGGISAEYRDYIDLERAANEILIYEQEVVPGLLQTADYAFAVIQAGWPVGSVDEIAEHVQVRLKRQEILSRTEPSPPQVRAVFSEGVLARMVGGNSVMRAQLEHLVELGKRPNVHIQVLPFAAGAHPAMVGPFTKLVYSEPGDTGVVYVAYGSGALFLEDEVSITKYGSTWNTIQDKAFSSQDSNFHIRTQAYWRQGLAES